jgi:esterase/lipase superfamily enzyme
LRHIILVAPDIDIDVFKEQAEPFPRRERRVYVLISKDDKALAVSRRIAGEVNRVGAESANELAELGVTVIDLTEVDDESSLNHAKFADSPEVVQLIGDAILQGNTLQTAEPGGGPIAGLAAGLTAIPAAIAGGSGRILVVGN